MHRVGLRVQNAQASVIWRRGGGYLLFSRLERHGSEGAPASEVIPVTRRDDLELVSLCGAVRARKFFTGAGREEERMETPPPEGEGTYSSSHFLLC